MANNSIVDWIKAFTGIAIPVVLLLLGNNFSSVIKEKELKMQYVDLAVQILQQEPSEENKNIRNWAIEVINKYSNIPINSETRKELKNIKIIPSQKFQSIIMDPKTFETLNKSTTKLKPMKRNVEKAIN